MLTKEAIEYLMEQGIDPHDRHISIKDSFGNSRNFIINNKGEFNEIMPKSNQANTLKVGTLTGFVDYMKQKERHYYKTFIHVEDERTVSVVSDLNSLGERERLITAVADIPHFEYEYFHGSEELIIALQSKFTQTKDRDILLKVIGNIKEENVRNTGDTGFSQAVTVQTGITSVEDVKVPNPVTLAPYRTFLEVEQPSSEFIFRMKDGPRAALFEADGGVWRNVAINNIKNYLQEAFKEEIENDNFIVIA